MKASHMPHAAVEESSRGKGHNYDESDDDDEFEIASGNDHSNILAKRSLSVDFLNDHSSDPTAALPPRPPPPSRTPASYEQCSGGEGNAVQLLSSPSGSSLDVKRQETVAAVDQMKERLRHMGILPEQRHHLQQQAVSAEDDRASYDVYSFSPPPPPVPPQSEPPPLASPSNLSLQTPHETTITTTEEIERKESELRLKAQHFQSMYDSWVRTQEEMLTSYADIVNARQALLVTQHTSTGSNGCTGHSGSGLDALRNSLKDPQYDNSLTSSHQHNLGLSHDGSSQYSANNYNTTNNTNTTPYSPPYFNSTHLEQSMSKTLSDTDSVLLLYNRSMSQSIQSLYTLNQSQMTTLPFLHSNQFNLPTTPATEIGEKSPNNVGGHNSDPSRRASAINNNNNTNNSNHNNNSSSSVVEAEDVSLVLERYSDKLVDLVAEKLLHKK